MSNDEVKTRIFGMGKSPTFEYPYLDPLYHEKIIESFKYGRNAVHCVNTRGEVDFFILMTQEEVFDAVLDSGEHLMLTLQTDSLILLSVEYEEIDMLENPSFEFRVNNQVDRYSLEWLNQNELISIYYMFYSGGEIGGGYVCAGLKTVTLPFTLNYDLKRYLAGKEPLRMPFFLPMEAPDSRLSDKVLTSPAMGFYLNYTKLLERFDAEEKAEEVFYRHFLHGLSRIQLNRRKEIREQPVYVWISKFVALGQDNKPAELYGIFLQIQNNFEKNLDGLVSLLSGSLEEFPEFIGTKVVFPLEEEGFPVVIIVKGNVERIRLTNDFFLRANKAFSNHYAKHNKYRSCYERLINSAGEQSKQDKVVNFIPVKNFAEPDEITGFHKTASQYIQEGRPNEIIKLKPEVVDKLCDADEESERVKESLVLLGDAAFPFVLPLLSDVREYVRLNAVEIMGLMGSARALAAVIDMPIDESAKVEDKKNWVKSLYKKDRL